MSIYLDSTATVFPDEETIEVYKDALLKYPYNPSAMYGPAAEESDMIKQNLERLASCFDCRPDQIIVCSGATEASNTVIKGRAFTHEDKKYFISSEAEHPATTEALEFLRRLGRKVKYIRLAKGIPDIEELAEVLSEHKSECALVSLIAVNNETGAISDLQKIGEMVKKLSPQTPLHFDCVQMPGKYPFSFKKLDCDYLTLAGHKMGAPKGIGFLLNKGEKPFEPLIHGGGQQKGKRSGTENLPLLMAATFAIERYLKKAKEKKAHLETLRKLLFQELRRHGVEFKINGEEEPGERQIAHIASVVFPALRSETLLNALSAKDIYVSAGSACAAKISEKQGRMMKALGYSPEMARHVLRITLSENNSQEEIIEFVAALADAIKEYAPRSKR